MNRRRCFALLVRSPFIIALSFSPLLLTAACAKDPVDQRPAPQMVMNVLREHFLLAETLEIIRSAHDRLTAKAYFAQRSKRFSFMQSAQQGPFVTDGYTALDLSSPVVGYSLGFIGEGQAIGVVNAGINPLKTDLHRRVLDLIAQSLDSREVSASVGATGPDKVYFLGLHPLDTERVLKIMVRAASTPVGVGYSIQYLVSERRPHDAKSELPVA
jgi:hypothetical protein